MSSDAHIHFESAPFIPQNQYVGSSHQTQRNDSVGLELGPPQQESIGFQQIGSSMQPSNLNSYDDWSRQRDSRGIDDFFSEEEIRTRSHEMLENEDMQQLLRVFSMGGTVNLPEDGYSFSSYNRLMLNHCLTENLERLPPSQTAAHHVSSSSDRKDLYWL